MSPPPLPLPVLRERAGVRVHFRVKVNVRVLREGRRRGVSRRIERKGPLRSIRTGTVRLRPARTTVLHVRNAPSPQPSPGVPEEGDRFAAARQPRRRRRHYMEKRWDIADWRDALGLYQRPRPEPLV